MPSFEIHMMIFNQSLCSVEMKKIVVVVVILLKYGRILYRLLVIILFVGNIVINELALARSQSVVFLSIDVRAIFPKIS